MRQSLATLKHDESGNCSTSGLAVDKHSQAATNQGDSWALPIVREDGIVKL